MNEFSACIGLVQLKKLDRLNQIRRKIAKRYYDEIRLEQKKPLVKDCSYHFYWIMTKNRETLTLDKMVEQLDKVMEKYTSDISSQVKLN